jgi:serine/threonine protein kinase
MEIRDPDSRTATSSRSVPGHGELDDSATEVETTHDRLLPLLGRWEQLYLQRQDASPESIGVEDPGLKEELRRRTGELRRLYDFLGLPNLPEDDVTAELDTPSPVVEVVGAGNPPSSESTMRIGRYLVVESLGEGGQGQVFRVIHPELAKELVLKLAWRLIAADPDRRERLLREGRLLADCEHPNLVRVVDLDFHEGRPFVVMEHVRGLNLQQYTIQRRPGPRQAARLVAALARAVAYLQARGIVHQDIKPRNVLLGEDGRPRLIDFGLARLWHGWSGDADGSVGGTTSYMSPEQALGNESRIGPWTDVFGLGGVLYYLLTGRPVYQASSGFAALQQASKGEQVPPRRINTQVPRALDRICLKALAPDPEHRYRSASDLERALRRWLWSPWVVTAFLVALASLAVPFLASWTSSRLSTPPAKSHSGSSEDAKDLAGVPLPRITAFEIEQFRQDGVLKSIGTIGKSSDQTQCGDKLRVLVRFDTPVYCYLIALNPNGIPQPCYPEQETEKPTRGNEVGYPSYATGYFDLSDGPGLQAFVILASRKPLPPYAQWAARDGWPWKHLTAEGVWWYDGRWIRSSSSGHRGVVTSSSDSPQPFQDVCEYLAKLSGIEISQAIAFPVKPND